MYAILQLTNTYSMYLQVQVFKVFVQIHSRSIFYVDLFNETLPDLELSGFLPILHVVFQAKLVVGDNKHFPLLS